MSEFEKSSSAIQQPTAESELDKEWVSVLESTQLERDEGLEGTMHLARPENDHWGCAEEGGSEETGGNSEGKDEGKAAGKLGESGHFPLGNQGGKSKDEVRNDQTLSQTDHCDLVRLQTEYLHTVQAGDKTRSPFHPVVMKRLAQSMKELGTAAGPTQAFDSFQQSAVTLANQYSQLTRVEMMEGAGAEDCSGQERKRPSAVLTPWKESEVEDAQNSLLPGLELGEELETKSGSSHTSCRGLIDTGVDAFQLTPSPSLLTSLLPALQRSRDLTQAQDQRIHLLTLEHNYLTHLLSYEADLHTQVLTRLHSLLDHRNFASKGKRPHPLLNLRTKGSGMTLKKLVSSLQDDIVKLQNELEVWQRSMSPVFQRTIDLLTGSIQSVFPAAKVRVYGSLANNLHLPSSDIDLLVLNSGLSVLETLSSIEKTARSKAEVKDVKLIPHAVIPVLQLVVQTETGTVRVDVTVNEAKHRGVKCTHVVRNLLRTLPQLRWVFLTLKQVFHYCEANQPFKGGLGSYTLFIMTAALLKRELRSSPAEYVLRFLQYYGYEFHYYEAIGLEPAPTTLPSMSLVVQDAVAADHNTARATNLAFLLVPSMQHFLQVAYFYLVSPPACKCSAERHVLLRTMLATKSWLASRTKF